MNDALMGTIILFGGAFAPRGWAYCYGQLLSIAQNTALFSLLGTTYGGDGITTFALPDLQGRVPVGTGNGAGLAPCELGEKAGNQQVTLLNSQMPAHTHQLVVSTQEGSTNEPNNAVLAAPSITDEQGNKVPINTYGTTPTAAAAPNAISFSGGNQPVNIMQPYLGLSYIICTEGIYPSRN